MARSAFKNFMNTQVTNNQYYFYEKGMFALTTGIMVYAVIIFHQPITEIKLIESVTDSSGMLNTFLKFVSYYLVLIGVFFTAVS